MRTIVLLAAGALAAVSAHAALKPEKVHTSDARKTEAYIKDGLFVGGDRAIDDVVVRDIRRASNGQYERVVIDLQGTQGGDSAAIPRPPYYHVAVNPDEKRLVFTLWGHPKLAFDSKKVVAGFKQSGIVSHVELLPRVDDDSWTFVIGLKSDKPVEVFELTNPVRVIVDIKGTFAQASAPVAKAAAKKKRAKKAARAELPRKQKGEAPTLDQPPETGATEDASEEDLHQ
jgi:hypothetical protein